ncbi:MAG: hypothetical protein H0V67_10090, partial [Geodermatophilaceae bacterium]|nr:hypothetical protein [Geodermatophilaceae bacterium]
PAWRVSYRLVGEQDAPGARRALLQGWAIFDNPFDEPLDEVRVVLVAGMPVSFVYDLYNPFTPERPHVNEEARVAAAPIEMERGRAAAKSAPLTARRMHMMAQSAASDEQMEAMAAPAYAMRDALAGGTEVDTVGEAAGDLFEYRIAQPVTVGRGEAAMVPILQTEVPYRKQWIFNGRKQPRHPSVVLRFDNDSDLTLERGPVAVQEDERYSGEAIFPFTRPGAEVLLAVAVDLGVTVREQRDTRRETRGITLERGFLLFQDYTTRTTTYEVQNSNAEPLSLLIEQPRDDTFEPLAMAEPEEVTEQHCRWRVEIPAGPDGHATFIVRERRLDRRHEQLASLTWEKLRQYLNKQWLDEALAGPLRAFLELQTEQATLHERLEALDQERARLHATQEQARKNMGGLREGGQEGELRARYVRQLGESEERLAALEAERARLQDDQARVAEVIKAQVEGLGG